MIMFYQSMTVPDNIIISEFIIKIIIAIDISIVIIMTMNRL